VRDLELRYTAESGVLGVSFDVAAGELLSLLGPSGCGKTTTLRCIAGIEDPEAGEIAIGDTVVSAPAKGVQVAPDKRDIGMVFQSYALWPHMTVADNVGYPLAVRRVPKHEVRDRVAGALAMVGLDGYGTRAAPMLSGGQQQRVALARALVYRPKLLLLDEPLSNLDAALREQMRGEVRRLQQDTGITAVYVTHDQSEAMAISDRIVVMNQGRIEQVGTPTEVFHKPVNRFVAGLVGPANFLTGVVGETTDAGATAVVRIDADGPRRVASRTAQDWTPGAEAAVCVRPNQFAVAAAEDALPTANRLPGVVQTAVNMGLHTEYRVQVGATRLLITLRDDVGVGPGDRVWVGFDVGRATCVRP
jgi:iron(III) transport system ATP-binding protein